MGAGSLIVLLNLAGGWWFMRRYVLRPVAHLANASARLSEGNLATRTHLTSNDELTGLGETMNHMAEALERKMAELEEKEQFLQHLVDAFPDGVRVIDQDYQVLLSNAAYRRQIGPARLLASSPTPGPDLMALPCYAQTHGQDQPCPETLITCPLHEVTRTGAPLRRGPPAAQGRRRSARRRDLCCPHDPDTGPARLATWSWSPSAISSRRCVSPMSNVCRSSGRLAAGVAHETPQSARLRASGTTRR